MILLNIVFHALQMHILRRKFPLFQFVQLPVSVAFGVYFEMQPRILYLPGNGLVFALYTKLQNIPYGTIKTIFAAITVGVVIRCILAVHKRRGGTKSA